MRLICVSFVGLGMVLGGAPSGLAGQDPASLKEEYWTQLHRGVQAAQSCLEDVMVEGGTEVPCDGMRPAFGEAMEVAETLEGCCPEFVTFVLEDGASYHLVRFAGGFLTLADSVDRYRGDPADGARSRRVELAARLLAWRTVVDEALIRLGVEPRGPR